MAQMYNNINKDTFDRMVKNGFLNREQLAKAKISVKQSDFEVGGRRATLVDIIIIEDGTSVSGADYLNQITGAKGTAPAPVAEEKPVEAPKAEVAKENPLKMAAKK